MDAEESITMNGSPSADDEMMRNHKKRTKDCFLMFCKVVLEHERDLLAESLNSSQGSINESRAPDGTNNDSIENSTFNSDSDGANGEISTYANDGEDGDSFNSVTCFCGKPFAGRPMIECSGCLTWLHMSCAKVKRKNIPEFYYCDNCKNTGMVIPPNNNAISNASSSEEGAPINNGQNGTISSNNIILSDDMFNSMQQNQNNNISTTTTSVKSRKPKMARKNPSNTSNPMMMMMSSSDIIKNSSSDSKYLNKKSSTTVNGKLKKMRKTISPSKKVTKASSISSQAYAISSSSLAAAASLTALSLNHHNTVVNSLHHDAITMSPPENTNLLKSPIATNNNNIYSNEIVIETQNSTIERAENGNEGSEKYNKRLKLL